MAQFRFLYRCPSVSADYCVTTNLHYKYPERTTDHGQATGKLYHLRLRKFDRLRVRVWPIGMFNVGFALMSQDKES
jgi:hypothetical protein